MALLSAFKLGRAGYEVTFEVNPSEYNPTEQKLVDQFRGSDGTLNELMLARYRSPVRIPGNYITPTFWNQLRQLMMIDDVPLVFEPFTRAGFVMDVWQEKITPSTTALLKMRDNPFWVADRLRSAAGAAPTVQLLSVWTQRSAYGGMSGQGSSYAWPRAILHRENSTISFSPVLSTLDPLYVSYRASAYAVRLYEVPSVAVGGQVNTWKYDLELRAA